MMAHAEASDAKREARRAQSDAAEMEARLVRLAMACEALWTILRDKLGASDEDLLDRITEIDLSDGRLDGKAARTAVSCPKCEKTIARRFPNCMYCGQAVMHDPFS
jgi:hypothetical protein